MLVDRMAAALALVIVVMVVGVRAVVVMVVHHLVSNFVHDRRDMTRIDRLARRFIVQGHDRTPD